MKISTRFPVIVMTFLGSLCLFEGVTMAQVFSASNRSMKQSQTVEKSLRTALKEVENKFKISIMANSELLDGKTVMINKLNSIEESLNAITQPHRLSFEKISDKQYVIFSIQSAKNQPFKTDKYPNGNQNPSTVSIANPLASESNAQKIDNISTVVIAEEIKGKIISADGEPLPGASVFLKNSPTTGTTTDANGSYKLSVPKLEGILVISYIGYDTRSIEISGRKEINVSLSPDQKNLDEVVVIGYGTQKRSSLTGAVSGVKADDLKNLPAQNLGTLLQGRVPGLFVTNDDGSPGSGSKIVIRGPVSINGGDPLIVVDGLPFQGTGFDFNGQDIETVEILKDAAAAAIYGAQAAAGVILVTTKKGKAGQMKVNFNTSYGVRNVFNLPQTLRRDEYLRAKEAFGFDVVDLYGPKTGWSGLPDTDWFKEVYRQGSEQSYNLSLAGGGDKSTFFISGNYSQINGTRVGNSFEKYNLRINSDHKINSWINFGQTLFINNNIEDPNSSTNQGDLSFRNTPLMKAYDPTNPIGGWGRTTKGFQGGNDVQAALGNNREGKFWGTTLSGYLDFRIIEGLNFRALLGTTFDNYDEYSYSPRADVGTILVENFDKTLLRSQKLISTLTLNYNKTIGQNAFKVLLGYEARKENDARLSYKNINPLVANPQSGDLVKNTTLATAGFNQSGIANRILSQFARVEYAYAGKYLLTANVRRDGIATKFGPNNRFGVFPGVSAGWRISEESFMRELPAVSSLKLRASYGVLGNSNIPNFLFTSAYGQGYSADIGTLGNRQSSINIAGNLANPDVQWEEVATSNIGIDGALFKNKLFFNIDYYNRQTNKMLYGLAIAPSAGLGEEVKANIGQMTNTGLEINLEWRNKTGDFTYSVGVNGAFNGNKLVSLNPELGKRFLTNGGIDVEHYDYVNVSRSEPGQALGQFYGYNVTGIYQANASATEKRPVISAKDNYVPRAGDLIYQDLNNDGKINDDDRTYIGNPWPKLTYGINLNAAYKGFDLRVFFSGVNGNQIYNGFESFEHKFFSDYTTTNKIFQTSGFAGNGVTNLPRVGKIDDLDNNGNWSTVSSYHVQDGSYLRLKNIQFGYTLPKSVLNSLKIRSARVYVMADNLLTFTGYKGINPEIGGPRNQEDNDAAFLQLGIDSANKRYPMSKLLSFGLNLEF
jgi:TonB-dependent starch-binding outer membrane protein SusC